MEKHIIRYIDNAKQTIKNFFYGASLALFPDVEHTASYQLLQTPSEKLLQKDLDAIANDLNTGLSYQHAAAPDKPAQTQNSSQISQS